MRPLRFIQLTLACGLLVAGCLDRPVAPTQLRLDPLTGQVISDGAHSAGNQHFFFLPPLVPERAFSGEFDRAAAPTVRICEWAGSCIRTVVTFATVDVEESEAIDDKGIKVKRESYVAKWKTKDYGLDPAATYRISVLVAGTELGFADVDVVPSQGAARNVNTNEYIPLVEDQTLKIPFRIEQGAVLKVGAAGGTVSSPDGNASLVVPPGMFSGEVGLTVQPSPLPASGYAAASLIPGTAYEFGPSGSLPAPGITAVLKYDPAQLGGADPATLRVLRLVGDKWAEIQGSVVDQVNHTVSATLTHFSTFAVGTQTVATIVQRGVVVGTGSTKQLAYTGGANRYVVWGSTDPSIASIPSTGNPVSVSGVAAGQAEIGLVTAVDASTIEYVDRIFVRVVDPGQIAWDRNKEGVVFNHLFGIHGSAANDIWIVGTVGMIIHYTGVLPPTIMTSNTTQILRGVFSYAPNDVYAVGGNASGSGVVLRYKGSSWTPLISNGPVFFGVAGNGDYTFAVGQGGQIYRYGVNDALTTIPTLSTVTYRGVATGNGAVYAVGVTSAGTGIVVRSFDDFDHWQQWTPPSGVTVGSLNAVWVDPVTGFVVVVGDNGLVLGSNDDGATWIPEPSSFPNLRAVTSTPEFTAHQDVYFGGDQGTMTSGERCLCGFGGDQFQAGRVKQGVTSLWTDPNGLIWGVGFGGLIFQQNTPGGHTFKALAQGQIFADVWVSGSGRVLAASNTLNSEIITDPSFGADGWFSTLLEWNGNGFNGLNANDVAKAAYAVGPFGSMFRQDFNTGVWTRLTSGTNQHLLDAWVSNTDVTYVVGNGGTVLKTTTHGASWSSVATGLPTNVDYTQVWGFNDTQVIIAASDGSIYYTTNGGASWTQVRTGPGRQYPLGLWAPNVLSIYMAVQDLNTGHGAIVSNIRGSWISEDRPETRYLAGAWGTTGNDVFMASNNGNVLHISGVDVVTNKFIVNTQNTGTQKDLYAVYGTGNIIFAVGNAGAIMTGTRP